MVTFTRKSRLESLTDALDHLYASFKKVRRADAWKNYVAAGAAVCEIKRGSGSGEWHVHLHCLVIGKGPIPWKPLSDAWYLATGDSFVVDLREVAGERGVGYVTKYLGKGFDQSVIASPDDLRECIIALGGRRMLNAFGAWYGAVGDVELQQEGEWKLVGSLHGIVAAAERGEEWAKGVMMNLRREAAPAAEAQADPPFWRNLN